MTCAEAQNLLAGLPADALAAPERSAVGIHLASCPSCTEASRRLRQAWDFLDGLQPPAVPMDLGQRLKSAATAKAAPEVVHEPPPPPLRIPRKAWLLALAVLLAGAGGYWEYLRKRPAPPLPKLPEAQPIPWSHEGIGPMALPAAMDADLWVEPGSRGALTASGMLRLDQGLLWGAPPPGRDLRLNAGGWIINVTRGRFSVRVEGTVAAFSCHEPDAGLAVIESGPGGFVGPFPLEAGKDGACVLLMPKRPPFGPRPLRSPYPGEGRP